MTYIALFDLAIFGVSVTPSPWFVNLMHAGLVESACRSLTCFAVAKASKRTVFRVRIFRSKDPIGSKGG